MKVGDIMRSLSDELLIEAYFAALRLKLDCDFISLLFSEISSRKIML